MQDGTVYGLPIVLDTADESIKAGDVLKLTYKGADLAVMTVTEKFKPNKPLEAKMCYGTSSLEHPGVQMISMERGKYYLGMCLRLALLLLLPLCVLRGVRRRRRLGEGRAERRAAHTGDGFQN